MTVEARGSTVPLPITIRKRFGRDGVYVAAYVGLVAGHGGTQALARAELLENLSDLVKSLSEAPAVVRDDLGQTWFLAPEGTGYCGTLLRTDGTASARVMSGGGTPSEAADRMVADMPGSVRLA